MKSPISIKRREPALGPDPDYSKALYCDPPSHDFCVWLVIAEMMRRYHGAPGPLTVRFLMIEDRLGAYDFGPFSLAAGRVHPCGYNKQYSDMMLANVLRPAIQMMGAVEGPVIHAPLHVDQVSEYVEYDYHIGHLVDAGREGHKPPQWHPPQWAHDEVMDYLGDERPIIITLRETWFQPERNSQLSEWLKFAASVKDKHRVLFIRDTRFADQPLEPFETWERASRNVYVRAALYQRAMVNMMVCNGPNTWCIFSDAPYLIFKELVPALPNWAHGQPIGWKVQDHMDVGDQYAWATPQQRLTWTDDTFEEISKAFDEFVSLSMPVAA